MRIGKRIAEDSKGCDPKLVKATLEVYAPIDVFVDYLEYMEREETMTGNEYQKLAGRTINQDLDDIEQMMHSLHGMVGEVGEIHSLFQKVYQGHEIDEEHLMKEVGDLLWFIAEFCTSLEWELEDIMKMNIEKLKARFPEGFTVDGSLHRQEGDI